MADQTRNLGINNVISLADDLIGILKSQRDVEALAHIFDSVAELQFSCGRDDSESLTCMEDVKQRIETCRQKIADQKETIEKDEVQHFQSELQCEIQKEQELRQELRKIMEQMDDLETVYIEERKKHLMCVKNEGSRAQSEISLYASVTKVIPAMADKSGISGYIVDRGKGKVGKFSFDPVKASAFEICNSLWRMGDI
ncbi:unnamed protein product [Victoria cruziana]